MEIIRHKTQKIIVMAMLAIMIMCIATPVFAAKKLEFEDSMKVTKSDNPYVLTEKNTTGQKVWWNTEEKGVITIVNGGLNRYGKTFVRFQANKEGKEYLIAKDAPKNGKEVARCLVEVKSPGSGKKDDDIQTPKKEWEMPDWNIELPEMDYEMPDLNIDTSGLADAAGTIGEGLISGIGKIGESGIFENLIKMITDLITGIINSLKNINLELPSIGNTNIFKPEEKVLKLEIGKKELKVGETTIIKAIVNGEEVNEGKVTFDTYYYNEDGTQTNEILYSEVYAISIKAEKVGKVVINATYKYKEGFEEKEIRAQEEIKIKSRTLNLEIGKTNMNVDETTNLKATIDGQAVSAEFKLASYDQNGKAIKDNVVEIKGEKVTALKAGKAVITATWANSSTREIMSAEVEVQIKEKPQQQQQNPPNQGTGTGNNSNTYYDFPQTVDGFYIVTPYNNNITEEQQRKNMNEIIQIFRNNTTYNDAVIAGVLGNARCESYYDPNKKTLDTNDAYSYGIWQNNEKGRYPDLVKFCNEKGYTATSLKGQTMFIIHCMESGGVGDYSNIPNTEAGAQTAADRFRSGYERSGYGKDTRKTAAKHIFNIMQR